MGMVAKGHPSGETRCHPSKNASESPSWDDYQRVALSLADWSVLDERATVIVFFALLLGAGVLVGVPIAFCLGLSTVASLATRRSRSFRTPLS